MVFVVVVAVVIGDPLSLALLPKVISVPGTYNAWIVTSGYWLVALDRGPG